ncbi:MAG: hypothetical protein ACK502_10870 [Alphaproteobacteria bacterium]|jgi:hypothetical protein
MQQLQQSQAALNPQAVSDLLCTIMMLCYAQHPDGSPFWAYLVIRPSMAKAFADARDSGAPMDLADYGTIVETGEGVEVPTEVQKRMARDFGARDDYEDQLANAVEALKAKYLP